MNRFGVSVRAAVCAVVVGALSFSVEAMTFAELQAAVDAAEDGATVYVTSDMEFDAPLVVATGKSITVEGLDEVFTLTRASTYADGTFFKTYDKSDNGVVCGLTIKNIVLDLQCGDRAVLLANRVIHVENNQGLFTLGSGSKICNAYQGGSYPGCMMACGGTIIMEEGAEIRHVYNAGYGVAVLVGHNCSGRFVMQGGLITDCHGPAADVGDPDWGAAVYVWGGQFVFNGGTITGNSSPYHNGGVVLAQGGASTANAWGVMLVGGHGAITGNVGRVSNDVYCFDAKENIWIVNNAGGMPYVTTTYDGATFTVKSAKVDPVLGGRFPCCTLRMGCDSTFSGIGNISLQDDPTIVLGESFGSATSRYYPTLVRKRGEARADGRLYTCPKLITLLEKASGKTGTITLFDDFEYEASYAFQPADKTDVLITSASAESPHEIKLPDNATWGFITLSDGGDTIKKVRLENVIVDGNRGGGARVPNEHGLFDLARGATLELGPGAVLRNAQPSSGCGAIRAISLSTLRMEEGAVISNMVAIWSSAILLGRGGDSTPRPTFNMEGGLITGCCCTYAGSGSGYGGAVYLWGATMNMSGGEITGNSAPNGGTAGVHLENGSSSVLNLSGNAKIYNNTGHDRDIFNRSCSIHYCGDFRGYAALAQNSVSSNISPADQNSTGAWCFFRSSDDPTLDRKKWGYLNNGSVAWGDPVGWIDEYGFVLSSDVDVRLSDAEDLSTAEARAKLPHVLSGAALAGTISQTLTYDPVALAQSDELPLCLYRCDGGAFTGTVDVTTPADDQNTWVVRRGIVDNVAGLYLKVKEVGLMLRVR